MDMKAMVIESFGGVDELKLVDIPTPQPKDNEVLIQVEYAAVNPVDWKIREGLLKSRIPHEFPLIPGWDASGTIVSIGKNVRNFKVGDQVFAYCRKPIIKEGTYAEFICFDASQVSKKPSNISFAQAAAIPLAALTAWQALFDFAHLQKGQTILIHAGSGGVGSFAIQFAKTNGARVLTTCSQANHDYVKRLGADLCIDYHKDNFVDKVQQLAGGKIDVVLDTVGGKTLKDSIALVKPGGCLVSITEPLAPEVCEKNKIKAGFIFVRPDGQELNQISKLIEEGKVQVPEIQELNLKDAGKAQEMSRQGHTRGKIVLKIGK